MDLKTLLFEAINLRSFSNIWYWLVVAALWSIASNRIIGVPWDMVISARRQGGQALLDAEGLAHIHARRWIQTGGRSGLMILGLTAGLLSALAVWGFIHGIEFAQGLFLLLAPLTLVGLLSFRTASAIASEDIHGEALFRRLNRHRMVVQGIALLAIFVTAMWGMYHNMLTSVLGN